MRLMNKLIYRAKLIAARYALTGWNGAAAISRHSIPLLGTALILSMALSQTSWAQQQKPAVDVANPLVKKVREWDQYTGRFQAVERVEIRARVSGYLASIHFKDGQLVQKGDLLFVIDQRPFEAELAAAEARLQSAKSQLKLSEANLARGQRLRKGDIVSEAELDERKAQRDVSAAAVLVAEADAMTAKLNLGFTEIRSPVSGRVSDSPVDVGNLIAGGTTGATLLTTIVSLDPIHFVFDVSEKAYLKYARLDDSGARPGSRTTPNPVYVQLADETDWPRRGAMNFVDNEVGLATGTVRGRAIFPNPNLFLQPGLFGEIKLVGSGEYEAVLVPDKAILADQSEKIVMVVGADNKVSARKIDTGPIIDGLRVVKTGLTDKDTVIINGITRVQAGAEVAPNAIQIEATPDAFDPTPIKNVETAPRAETQGSEQGSAQ